MKAFLFNISTLDYYSPDLKGYLRYKTTTSQNALSEAQVKKKFFHKKVTFCSQGIQVFVFLAISSVTKSVTS